ncbi:hypothetical protein O3M35_008145 [Rhynocoris fuscipes]|uniref:28S ribosomal protein S30, mitochondrial n=1 Tax=Rhynocoris fuscipes TaxID=488301 RepID=A0AAW1DCS5_9HEMI
MNPYLMGQHFKLYRFIRRFSSLPSNEYSASPKYPTILDLSPKETRKRERNEKYEKYNNLHTVEEKLFALNLDRYYGWNSLILREHAYPYQFLPFVKFITRTYSVEVNQDLFHKILNVDIDQCKLEAVQLRKHLQDAIIFELKGKRNTPKSESKDDVSKRVLETVNSEILSCLSNKYPHLLHTMVDYEPRLEAFWMVGSFEPSEDVYQERKNKKVDDEELNSTVDHWIQYFGAPVIQLRHQLPLPSLETQLITEYNDSTNIPPIPIENSDPSLNYGIECNRRHGTSIPGYWPGDEYEFGLLSYHTQGYLLDRPPHFGQKEHDDTIAAQSILASYGWLHGQASYQGFSTFTDMTYPLITQNIISDGRQFNFSSFQLNTTVLHSENSINNPRVNIHIRMPSSLLYKEINGNEFIGWNDDVVSTLLLFYLNEPKKRDGLEMKPYLHKEEKYLSNIADEARRVWLHNQFRHMYSNRPRHKLPYEIYDWERIYKIKFASRYFDARFRPFELDSNPLEDRKYKDHMPPYVPRQFRPKKKHWTGWRSRFAKTYYPDV